MAQSNRRKSKKSVKDQGIIQIATWFRQWGFMDYIAARTLFTRSLEVVADKVPSRAQNIDELQKTVARSQHDQIAKGLEVGELLLPACALAATSVEKYFKAIVTLKEKTKPKTGHLSAKLVRSVQNSVKRIFEVINKDFIKYLRKCYELGYFDEMDQQSALVIRPRMVLSALDFTIAELEKTLTVTLNGFEIPYSYQSARDLKMPALWQHNYVLQGMNKLDFLKQQDFSFKIICDLTTGLRILWHSTDNTEIDDQFFVKAFSSVAGKTETTRADSPEVRLKLESAIMHYSSGHKRETGKS